MPCASREDIRDIDPGKRTPAHAVEAHVDVEHGSHGLGCIAGLRCRVRVRVGAGDWWWVCLEDGANDEEEDTHAEGGDDEGKFTTQGFDTEEDEDGGGDDLDDTVDTRGQQRVLPAEVADGREDLRSVVVDAVLTSPLLEEEDNEGDDEANEVALAEEGLLPAESGTSFSLFL